MSHYNNNLVLNGMKFFHQGTELLESFDEVLKARTRSANNLKCEGNDYHTKYNL